LFWSKTNKVAVMAETDRSITTEEAKGIDIEKLLKTISADKNGLSTSAAKDRLQKFLYGYNEITEKKESLLLKLLSFFVAIVIHEFQNIKINSKHQIPKIRF
jgi:hypothetical protein